MGAPVCYRVPQKLMSYASVSSKQVACGRHYMALLTKEGKVYTWGKGNFGVLGIVPMGVMSNE